MDDPYVTELLAGQNVDVGEVQVWNDGESLYVKYLIDADLTPAEPSDDGVPTLIYQTHLSVAAWLAGIPQTKKGNPVVGQFDYSTVHDPGVAEFTYEIPLADVDGGVGEHLFIAAHAVVQKLGGLEGLELALPGQVVLNVTYPGTGFGEPSYFDASLAGGTILDGAYDSYCVDTDNTISSGSDYTADVYSSYDEALPGDLVEFPENLDLINWIINQGFVGQTSSGGPGTYTFSDVQRAIWTLIDDQVSTAGLQSWSQERVDEIVAAAQANGEGYEPGCGDQVAVILAPTDGSQVIIAQVTFAAVEVPCEEISETAWAEGMSFDGSSWAMYFAYIVQ
jgi:hypothetical protein